MSSCPKRIYYYVNDMRAQLPIVGRTPPLPRHVDAMRLAYNLPIQLNRLKDDVPKDFCVACLLPLWKVDGRRHVHHPTEYGHSNCKNIHKPTSRQLFFRARQQYPSVPAGVRSIVPSDFLVGWDWLFAGPVPGVLQLHLKMHEYNASRTMQ